MKESQSFRGQGEGNLLLESESSFPRPRTPSFCILGGSALSTGATRVSTSDQGVTEVPVKLWSRGGLSWTDLGKRLWVRSLAHDLLDRAALLSFYLLLSFFPLLIFLSSLTGILLSSQTETYWRLLNYV